MKENIIIGVEIQNKIFDLKVPINVTMKRLKELLKEALNLVGVYLPDSFDLVVKSKQLNIDLNLVLSEYPLSDGDQFIVVLNNDEGGEFETI